MKKLMISVFVVFFAGAVIVLTPAWGQQKNLGINKEVTAKIRSLDRAFFDGFDVYSAGTTENPTALLFDIKDDYTLAVRLWQNPLTEEAIIYAIPRLDDQYREQKYDIPFEPRAINIVNSKGEILGYMYTGMMHVVTDRKKDGRVIVFRPTLLPYESHGSIYTIQPPAPN